MARNREQERARYEANRPEWVERNRQLRARNRAFVEEAKRDKPCLDCGKHYPSFVMDFDHVRGEKVLEVAAMAHRAYGLAKLQEEIDKCELVCANCHRFRSWKRMAIDAR